MCFVLQLLIIICFFSIDGVDQGPILIFMQLFKMKKDLPIVEMAARVKDKRMFCFLLSCIQIFFCTYFFVFVRVSGEMYYEPNCPPPDTSDYKDKRTVEYNSTTRCIKPVFPGKKQRGKTGCMFCTLTRCLYHVVCITLI